MPQLGLGLGLSNRRAKLPAATTSTFFGSNSNLLQSGSWTLDTGNNFGKQRSYYTNGVQAGLAFDVIGNSCTIWCRSNSANNLEVWVDGTRTVPTISANTWTQLVLFTGLAHARRSVFIRNQNSTLWAYNASTTTEWAVSVDGQPPSIALTPAFASSGLVTSNLTALRHDGTMTAVTPGGSYNGMPGSSANDCHVRFSADATKVSVFLTADGANGPNQYTVARNGVVVAQDVQIEATGAGWKWYTLASGLTPGTAEYRVTRAKGGIYLPWQVAVDNSLSLSALSTINNEVFYGDSIIEGATGVSNSTRSFAYLYGLSKGIAPINRGLGFRTVRKWDASNGASGTNAGEGVNGLASVTGTTPTPARIIILMGTNDAGNIGGTYNAAGFLTSYTAMLAGIRAVFATVPIYCLGNLDTTAASGYASNRSSVNTQIAQAVTNAADANTVYRTTDNWIVPATDTIDGLHPNAAGVAKIATQLLAM